MGNSNREYLYEGVISAAILHRSFWAAAALLGDDPSVHDMEKPYLDPAMDMIDTSGCGMPFRIWELMAENLAQGVK